MLEIRNLSAGYSGRPVLQNICFNAPSGQITALLGPNGCGKSTLLRALCGILPIQAGDVRLDGISLPVMSPSRQAQHVSFLPQERPMPDCTVRRLALHGRFPYLSYPRRYRPEDYAAAERAMEQADILSLADMPISHLSGGQRQKAYIAMALAQDTPVMLLDEPTAFLDVSHQLQLLRLARRLADSGRHILMVIHDLPHALQTADQIVLMDNGRVVMQADPETLFLSGELDRVFSIRLRRFPADGCWQYVCKEDIP